MYNNMLTSSVSISQLLTDDSGISAVPTVITHCPPLVIDAHFHSTLILIGASHQTNITISAVASSISYSEECVITLKTSYHTTQVKSLTRVESSN